ncbi:hypothetical protein [Saliphagus sp. LR7]|uniref:hypothetical protein n=1 Tax=Saliphagus sp. LR7 TaxID=2282654 RepID=UPI001300B5BA|nr:hypothetical protein [Saliphagus sp. LR7]
MKWLSSQPVQNMVAVWETHFRNGMCQFLISGVLGGTMAGMSLAVSMYFVDRTVGLPVIKVGFGVAAGLAIARVVSVHEISAIESFDETIDNNPAEQWIENDDIRYSQMIAGLSPVLGIGITLLPFVLQDVLLSDMLATVSAVLVGESLLCGFGMWVGLVTHQKWYISGPRIAIFGLVTVGITVLIP